MTNAEPRNKFGLSPDILDRLRSVFIAHPNIEEVLVYGSRAKGNYRQGSDIDITMIGEQLQWSDMQTIELALDDLMLPYSIDLSIFHQIENNDLREHIKRWGQSLLETA